MVTVTAPESRLLAKHTACRADAVVVCVRVRVCVFVCACEYLRVAWACGSQRPGWKENLNSVDGWTGEGEEKEKEVKDKSKGEGEGE